MVLKTGLVEGAVGRDKGGKFQTGYEQKPSIGDWSALGNRLLWKSAKLGAVKLRAVKYGAETRVPQPMRTESRGRNNPTGSEEMERAEKR